MEDYLVIIITLIIAVVGALKGRKKKKAPPVAAPEGQNQNPDFWDMIMDNQGKNEEELVVDSAESEYQSANEPVVSSKQKGSDIFTPVNEGASDIKEEVKKVVKTKKRVLIEGEDFSLRKAVIYSEIMNRKYS